MVQLSAIKIAPPVKIISAIIIVIFLPNLSEKYPFVIDPIAAPATVIDTIHYLSESEIFGNDYFKNSKTPDITK